MTEENNYAGFWIRAIAYSIDCIILFIPLSVLFIAMKNADAQAAEGVGNIAAILLVWMYFSLMESSDYQATLGKKVLGLKVVDYKGQKISFLRATGRYFAKSISARPFFLGFFIAGLSERKQALHDTIAGCLVIGAPLGRIIPS